MICTALNLPKKLMSWALNNGVNLIEWPEKIGYLLPKNIWTVNIFTKDSARYFEVTVSDEEKKKRLEKLGYGD